MQSTRWLLRDVVERSGLVYADECGGISQISVEVIARRLGAGLQSQPLDLATQEIALPAYFGPPVIVVNKFSHPGMRALAIRHGLAHLVAGELEAGEGSDLRFMSNVLDHMTLEERRADLFALADLLPDWQLDALTASGAGPAVVERELRRHVTALAPEWPLQRIRDRSRLRLTLYQEGR